MTQEEEKWRDAERLRLREKEEHYEQWFATELLGRRSNYKASDVQNEDSDDN